MERKFLTVQDCAEVLGVHDATVRRWIAEGKLAAFQPGGRYGPWRVAREDLDRFLAASRKQAQPPGERRQGR